jgi:hypothetical protein
VILQQPIKHVFKVQFNTWTIIVIKEYIDNGQEPCVDFKMSSFKQKMCSWLHVAWTKVKEMRNMIIKGCNKIRLTKALKLDF